jgi:hypothetical protein
MKVLNEIRKEYNFSAILLTEEQEKQGYFPHEFL